MIDGFVFYCMFFVSVKCVSVCGSVYRMPICIGIVTSKLTNEVSVVFTGNHTHLSIVQKWLLHHRQTCQRVELLWKRPPSTHSRKDWIR